MVSKSERKPREPDEQISVEHEVAMVKELVTENVEGGHIVFCEEASKWLHILKRLESLVFLCFLLK